ncbi:hypothetical protein P9112_010461 [Eukaryota sp. TZLM1-RC]
MSDIFQQDIFDPNSSPNMQQQEPETHTHIHNIESNEATDRDPTSPSLKVEDERVDKVPPSSAMEEATRTDPAPSPLKYTELSWEATRTDPYPSPLPIIEPVLKGTDGNPTLDTSSPLGKSEEIQSQLDEMEGEDDSSDGFYKLLTRTRSLTSNQWTYLHSRSSLLYGTKHTKSRLHTRLRVKIPPPLLLYYNAKIRFLLL